MRFFILVLVTMTSLAGPLRSQEATGPAIPAMRNDWEQSAALLKDVARRMGGRVKLVFDGDSIMQGWTRTGNAEWKKRYEKFGAFNFALGGDRTQNVLWRLQQGQVDGLKPRLIVLLIGTNNIGKNPPEEIVAGIASVVEEYRNRCPEAVILVLGIFPRGQKADDPSRAVVREVNKEAVKLADGNAILFLDMGEKFLNADGSISPQVMPDFLHLSAKGYAIWAEALQPVMAKYFPDSGQ